MQIISHRGYWKIPEEKNTKTSFIRSFSLGFGTETDFRDLSGELVISHDPATTDSILAESFFEIHQSQGGALPLAMNIKADGLQSKLKSLIDRFNVTNYFVFDMSVPDTLQYIKKGFVVFTRQSEYEPVPPLYDLVSGVWVDGFVADEWITSDLIEKHFLAGKKVSIVSPELHGRAHLEFWERLKDIESTQSSDFMICTDFPEEARAFFNE